MIKSIHLFLSPKSLNTLMLLCVFTLFSTQQIFLNTATTNHRLTVSANEMYFKPRVPPPLIDPELIDFEVENVESYRDRLLQN